MSKCPNYNHCKNAMQEAERGDMHRCLHGKMFICVKSSTVFTYSWTERISPFRNPVIYIKARIDFWRAFK